MEVVSQEVKSRFLRLQMNSLIGVWIGYAAYYLVRSNFNLALPYLSGELDLSKTQLGQRLAVDLFYVVIVSIHI